MKIWFSFLIVIVVLAPINLAFSKTFGAETATLSNGLQIVVIPNHRAPVVTHMMWVKAGGADNIAGQSGMAHYLEHLMFKGTTKMAPGEYSKTIKTLGGNDNAFTGADYTAYFESVSVKNLPKVMELHSDRLQNLAPPPEHFISEKSVVLEERRQRTENDPRSLFGEQIYAALFINHPYGTPVVGWMDEIKNYEWPDVKKYYDTWYTPENMILVVSGDITMDQLKPLAEQYYGTIPVKNTPDRVRPAVPNLSSDTLVRLEHKQIHQPVFYKIYLAPTEAKDRTDSLALQVLSNILDGGQATRLYKSIVAEQKKATSISFSYNANALDYGTISIDATPSKDVDLEDMGEIIQKEIQTIIDNGVTEQEVKEAIQRLQDQAIFARDSVAGPAMIFGQAISTGSTVGDVENWPSDIGTITALDVQNAAKKYLNQNNPWVRAPITGYLLPEKILEPKEEAQDVRKP